MRRINRVLVQVSGFQTNIESFIKTLFLPLGWEIEIGWSGSLFAGVRTEGVPKGGVHAEELSQGELVAFPCSNLPKYSGRNMDFVQF